MDYSLPIKAIADRTQETLEGKKRGQSYLAKMAQLAAQAHSLHGVVTARNPAETEAAHMKKAHDAGERLKRSLEGLKHWRTETLNSTMEELRHELSARTGLRPAQGIEETLKQSEFRQAILRMEAGARSELVRTAAQTGDTDVLNAVLNAPAFTTGLDPQFLTNMRQTHESKTAPEILAEVEAIIEADHALGVAAETAERGASEAQNARDVAAIVQAEAAAQKARQTFNEVFEG